MELTPFFWEDRYLKNETGWDLGSVSPPLKNYFDQLSDKSIKILIPGGGNGYEAEYLFHSGFKQVFLLDWAIESLKRFKRRVKEFPKYQLINEDFFDHQDKYDLIIEQTFFCAIDPTLRELYAKHVHAMLNPGGRLVGLLFDDPLNTDHPPFGGSREEYWEYFNPYFEKHHFDTCYNSVEPRAGRELFINLVKKELP